LKRISLVFLLAAVAHAEGVVPLRDLIPAYTKSGERVYRSRDNVTAGLYIGKQRYRGLCVAANCRIGYEIDARFARLKLRVGVLDRSRGPIRFSVIGKGQTLASTPPLFPGAKPVELDVPLDGVLLLELVTSGKGRDRGAWIEGKLYGAKGKDLGRFYSVNAPFDPGGYSVAFKRAVNEGIDRGVQFLQSQQRGDGLWHEGQHRVGLSALATLALLKAGVKPSDPRMQRSLARMRSWNPNHVYTCAVLLMAIEANYFPGGHEERRAAIDRPRRARKIIPKEDRQWIARLAQWLAQQQGAGYPPDQRQLFPVWRYPHGGYDLSNTQYALFGLTAANRCGVPTGKVWDSALKFILGAQEKQGPKMQVSRYFRQGRYLRRRNERAQARGFAYTLGGRPTGAMTSAGLCSLVLCQAALRRSSATSPRIRAGIRDSLAWLEEYYAVDENPFHNDAWWTYYLFNLERVGVLLDQRFIGTRDWYKEGALLLLQRQASGGRFGSGVADTAFALLFLKRATVPAQTSPLK